MRTRRSSAVRNRSVRLAAPLALLVLGACSDGALVSPPVSPGPGTIPSSAIVAVTCNATVGRPSVSCTAVDPGRRQTLVGGQNTNVRLASSNVAYTAVDSTFAFDVTVQNLLPEAMGTTDGVTRHPNGIRVLFASGPSVVSGSGSATVANADDEGTFTGTGQPYFQYDTILATDQTSNPRNWQLHVDPSVTTFSFTVYVATELQPLLVINEMMANPGGVVQDSSGEYVEVYNRGRFPVNMNGMILNDASGGGIGGVDTVGVDLIVEPGGYRTLGRTQNTSKNGGITVDYNYVHALGGTSTLFQFSNSAGDHFRIRAATGVTIDSAGYTSSTTGAASGVARELTNPALNNTATDGPGWAAATTNYHASNKGTPGALNSTSTNLPPPGDAATVTLVPDSIRFAPGATAQLSATARDTVNQPTTTTFTWASRNAGVASVSASGLVTGVAGGTTWIVATSANGISDSTVVTVVPIEYLDHVEFGIPSDGTPDDEILLVKPQFVVGYSPTRGGPAWVSWNLNETYFGGAPRCDCFSPDTTLPDSVYKVVTGDYTGSGYSRGHMVMSEQRTASNAENAVTFLMTNILPQHQDQNGGPWLRFEIFNNDLAQDSAKELYVIAGGIYPGSQTTLNGAGKVQLPSSHWKIVVILERGETLADVSSTADIRVVAVNMPNTSGISGNGWEMYKTTVDAIEAATGFDFLADLPDAIESAVEASVGS